MPPGSSAIGSMRTRSVPSGSTVSRTACSCSAVRRMKNCRSPRHTGALTMPGGEQRRTAARRTRVAAGHPARCAAYSSSWAADHARSARVVGSSSQRYGSATRTSPSSSTTSRRGVPGVGSTVMARNPSRRQLRANDAGARPCHPATLGRVAHTLVLNATYEPLGVVAERRALLLVLAAKATAAGGVRPGRPARRTRCLALPAVIRLNRFVKVPHRGGGAADPAGGVRPRRRPVRVLRRHRGQHRPRGAAQPRRPAHLGQRRGGLPPLQPDQGGPHPGRPGLAAALAPGPADGPGLAGARQRPARPGLDAATWWGTGCPSWPSRSRRRRRLVGRGRRRRSPAGPGRRARQDAPVRRQHALLAGDGLSLLGFVLLVQNPRTRRSTCCSGPCGCRCCSCSSAMVLLGVAGRPGLDLAAAPTVSGPTVTGTCGQGATQPAAARPGPAAILAATAGALLVFAMPLAIAVRGAYVAAGRDRAASARRPAVLAVVPDTDPRPRSPAHAQRPRRPHPASTHDLRRRTAPARPSRHAGQRRQGTGPSACARAGLQLAAFLPVGYDGPAPRSSRRRVPSTVVAGPATCGPGR